MKRNGQITAFYIEALLLIVVFLAIILVLTQVFGLARQQSIAAGQLTDAVTLAGNAAEAVSACADPEELFRLLDEAGNAVKQPDGKGLLAYYDQKRAPDPKGCFCVDVSWDEEPAETGTMISSVIQVFCGKPEEPIYRLETSSFREA